MARYTVTVSSPRSPGEAFDYMVDLTNFAEWDPGVRRSVEVGDTGPVDGAAYDVTVNGVPRPITLRYILSDVDRPNRFVATATSPLLTSVDTITVAPSDDGSLVTYDAELTLNGLLGLADPLLSLVFGRIGDKAAAGLISALSGRRVDTPA